MRVRLPAAPYEPRGGRSAEAGNEAPPQRAAVGDIPLSIAETEVKDEERAIRAGEAILQRIEAIGGVSAAALISALPQEGRTNDPVFTEDPPHPAGKIPAARRLQVCLAWLFHSHRSAPPGRPRPDLGRDLPPYARRAARWQIWRDTTRQRVTRRAAVAKPCGNRQSVFCNASRQRSRPSGTNSARKQSLNRSKSVLERRLRPFFMVLYDLQLPRCPRPGAFNPGEHDNNEIGESGSGFHASRRRWPGHRSMWGRKSRKTAFPFTMTTVTTFKLPWRLAFLPDGRMLITEKPGPVWLVSQTGEKIQVENTPKVYWHGQDGMMGVFLSPHYATDHNIYLTYVEPGDYGGGYALARAKLNVTATSARLENFEVLWRQVPTGKGGQAGGPIAFSPDGKYLFLAVGDRQRMTPAQDPSQPVGKILRLTLDGKPAPGNPNFGKTGDATITLIDPPRDTEAAKTAKVVSTYHFLRPQPDAL